MTETQQLLEQVREKMSGATDYKIAQVLDIPRNVVHYYMKGERSADAYACTRFAEVLGRDPLEIIAMVESNAAKSEKRREFWKTFRSSGNRAILELLLCATLVFSGHALVDGANSVRAVFRRWRGSHNGSLRYIGHRNEWNRVSRHVRRRAIERGPDRRLLTLN